MTGIGEAYPCSASVNNTTVFLRWAITAAVTVSSMAATVTSVVTVGGVNLPLSRLSRYSAACNKAAMLIFEVLLDVIADAKSPTKASSQARGGARAHTHTQTRTT